MTSLTEPEPSLPTTVTAAPRDFALWEVTAVEQGDPITFFVVTDSPSEAPDVGRAYAVVRHGLGFLLDEVHSVRRVTRLRSAAEAGRFAGEVVADTIADQRTRCVAPAELGLGT